MSEGRMHAVFGVLFVLSFFVSDQARKMLPTWYDPQIGLLSLAIALLWLARFFLGRGKELAEQVMVLKDRLERVDRKIRALEDEQESR